MRTNEKHRWSIINAFRHVVETKLRIYIANNVNSEIYLPLLPGKRSAYFNNHLVMLSTDETF